MIEIILITILAIWVFIELIIKKLCKEREPLYEEIADFEIMTKNKRVHEIVNEIISITK